MTTPNTVHAVPTASDVQILALMIDKGSLYIQALKAASRAMENDPRKKVSAVYELPNPTDPAKPEKVKVIPSVVVKDATKALNICLYANTKLPKSVNTDVIARFCMNLLTALVEWETHFNAVSKELAYDKAAEAKTDTATERKALPENYRSLSPKHLA